MIMGTQMVVNLTTIFIFIICHDLTFGADEDFRSSRNILKKFKLKSIHNGTAQHWRLEYL